jgi:S1-C subfamily serine protease
MQYRHIRQIKNLYIILFLQVSSQVRVISSNSSNNIYIHISLLTAIFATVLCIHTNSDVQADAQVESESDTKGLEANNSTLALTDLFSNTENSVVQITSTTNTTDPFGTSLGSGFIYDTNGHIITNYHVLAQAATTSLSHESGIIVAFQDGSAYNAKLVASDPFSDISVLQVDNISESKLLPLPFGNSSQLKIGEQVVAIGNPFGLSGTMTWGIVSGLGRLIPSSASQPSPNELLPTPPAFPPDLQPTPAQTRSSFFIPDIIQTDAAVNPGNSGGPLLNLQGKVVGMNTAIFSNTGAYSGIGFAVPSNLIKKIVPSLIATESYEHPWLGVFGADITPDIAKALGLDLNQAKGFLVMKVDETSPAYNAGVRGGERPIVINGRLLELGGDMILKVDNQTVRKLDDILTYLEREKKVSDSVRLTVLRDGKLQEIDVTLAARPEYSANSSQITR